MHPSTRKLERIPPEIWQDIISRACTDGGATGGALALTCKFFRKQSLNARFYSLSFQSTNRLLIFLQSLRLQPKDCTPKIYHVLFTPSVYTGPIPRSLRHLTGNARPGQVVTSADLSENAMEALLSLAARQLRTLSLVASATMPFRHFVQPLPKLEELSVWNHPLCDTPPTHPGQHIGNEDGAPRMLDTALFPSLRRFLYVRTDPKLAFETVFAKLPLLAPKQLTHLRLSGVTYADERLPGMLAELIGVPAPKPLRERIRLGSRNAHHIVNRRGATFPNLCHVVINAFQPRPDDSAVDVLALSKWATVLGLLRELERTCKRVSGLRLVVLERSWLRKIRWATRMRADWVQRMSGGRGCWVESEAEESRIEGPIAPLTNVA